MPWEKGEASPGLVDFLAGHTTLARGKVCVPGCGTGHDAREWAKAGFRVYGYDLAPSAVRLSAERTQAAGLRAEFRPRRRAISAADQCPCMAQKPRLQRCPPPTGHGRLAAPDGVGRGTGKGPAPVFCQRPGSAL